MKDIQFSGPFAPMCELFVAQKRAAGLLYVTQAKLLRQFDAFCTAYDIQDYTITEEIAQEWYQRRPNEKDSSRRDRVQVLQHFSEFLCCQGYPSYLFPFLPKPGENHEPYIFTKEELRHLFTRLEQLEPNNYSTGYLGKMMHCPLRPSFFRDGENLLAQQNESWVSVLQILEETIHSNSPLVPC